MLIDTIAASPWLAVTLTLLFSLLIGSFLNVVIHRLPRMMEREWQMMAFESTNPDATEYPEELQQTYNLAVPVSSCPGCDHKIRWYENIPLISYFVLLRGRCSSCNTPISIRYPLIELFTALISAFIVYQYGFNLIAFSLVFLSWCLISLTAIDIDHQLLPDKITLPLLWLGLILNSFEFFTSLPMALWGAVLGYLSLWSVYWLFKLITGKEGMGYGDFKLLAALGAWAGADMLPLIILASSLIGAIIGSLMIAFRRHESQNPIPFGPYLAGAGWIALLYGHELTDWYLQLLNL
ncbi:prepilin peptidase [Amphritea balenae]|uniref:Prepilin leader peptidase/N-methyltransferase n=1 Tax=Amphritea balenae TaxID=452629 RepID=A0A3P1SSK5_9GAMM|nr:A24 family peptidase [Amphritea balenae]RRD00118.1 prepilin peptidase [Amphritea balenae]GGK76824.1 type 4 prepilin-like proteins leader peptide-processing enzyme [Amphritea balenae]